MSGKASLVAIDRRPLYDLPGGIRDDQGAMNERTNERMGEGGPAVRECSPESVARIALDATCQTFKVDLAPVLRCYGATVLLSC